MLEGSNLWWPSPAKLNLFLHINGRRRDGYHELQSLFQLLDYGDSLHFAPNDSGEIQLTTELPGVNTEQNLIVRAAKLLQKETGCSRGAQIALQKHLPMGGGIGGGSSNAATALVMLNHFWQTGLSNGELADLGLALGADVPIFVRGQTAFAEGVGERIAPVALAEKWYLVATPPCHVSTAEVFGHPDLPRNTPKLRWDDYTFAQTRNDCQNLVCRLYPIIANTLQRLLEYAPSRLTGTGASVFAIFEDKDRAQQALSALPADIAGFIAQGVNCSPLHQQLASLTQAKSGPAQAVNFRDFDADA